MPSPIPNPPTKSSIIFYATNISNTSKFHAVYKCFKIAIETISSPE